jgi:ribosomal protein S18 acetylase RimI-like enzyme
VTKTIDVVAATAADAPDIARIFTAARSQMAYLPSFPTADEMVPVFTRRITQGNVLLARCNGHAAGFAQLLDGYVTYLYVDPPLQGRGIGTRLLDTLKTMSPLELRLWVFEANVGAIRLYEREGFVLEEQRDIHHADNMEHLPDRRYVWRPESP